MKQMILCWLMTALMLPFSYANELEQKSKVGPSLVWVWSKTFYHSASGPGLKLTGQEKILAGEINAPPGYVMCGFYVKDVAVNRSGYWKVGTNLENKDKYFFELIARSGPVVDQFGSSVKITLVVTAVSATYAKFPSQQQFLDAKDNYKFYPEVNYEEANIVECPLNKKGVGRFGMVRTKAQKFNEYWHQTNIMTKTLPSNVDR